MGREDTNEPNNLCCSVVIGSNQIDENFYTSIESAITALEICPSESECIIVLDGLDDEDRYKVIARFMESRVSLHVICVPAGGLTRALIEGCRQARGEFIARLDVGDAMTSDRLARQIEAISSDPECVLATSAVEVCGPCWESLWVNPGTVSLAGTPTRVDGLPATQGLMMDIPHHSSVMIRRSGYEAVGGYRKSFYFGQDWDLWYRLALIGKFVHLRLVLTRVRLFSQGLSSRHWREQREIAHLSLACYVARSEGHSEASLLRKAAAICPKPKVEQRFQWDLRRAEGAYFIAEALRRNKDRRCLIYFLEASRHCFWLPKIWMRLIQSISIFMA